MARKRLIPYDDEGGTPGERVAATAKLVWADWPTVTDAEGRPTHCLTPASALRAAATMVSASWEARQEANGATWDGTVRPAIVFAIRRDVTMRNLAAADEAALRAALRDLAAQMEHELVIFDGSDGVDASIALFRRAVVCVGVHGGALSNMLWSAVDHRPVARALLLIELTVVSRIAVHYAHTASALGLGYKAVPLEDDGRGVGAANVTLAPGAVEAVVAHATRHLRDGHAEEAKDELR